MANGGDFQRRCKKCCIAELTVETTGQPDAAVGNVCLSQGGLLHFIGCGFVKVPDSGQAREVCRRRACDLHVDYGGGAHSISEYRTPLRGTDLRPLRNMHLAASTTGSTCHSSASEAALVELPDLGPYCRATLILPMLSDLQGVRIKFCARWSQEDHKAPR